MSRVSTHAILITSQNYNKFVLTFPFII